MAQTIGVFPQLIIGVSPDLGITEGSFWVDGFGHVQGPMTPCLDTKFKWLSGFKPFTNTGVCGGFSDARHNLVMEVTVTPKK